MRMGLVREDSCCGFLVLCGLGEVVRGLAYGAGGFALGGLDFKFLVMEWIPWDFWTSFCWPDLLWLIGELSVFDVCASGGCCRVA
jgi:hypothetical protein